MDLKSSHHNSPVITDPIAIINKSRLGIHSPSSTKYNSRRSTPSATTTTTTTLNDVRFNGWLDAMKASSPPRKKQTRPFNSHSHHHHLPPSTDHQDYSSWLLDYPSALDSFGKLIENARSKKIAVFLDYDGTLSPIVDDPDCAFMSEAMRGTVRSVANYFPTAIISGRSRDKVYDLVKLTELYYAGSHGMDIIGPASHTLFNNHPNCVKSIDPQGKDITLFQPAREFLPVIDEVYRKLVETTKDIEGAKVENHKFCVSVHYRNVEENNWRGIGQRVHDVLEDYPLLRSTHGRKVLDVRPVIDWNKGKAVEFLLDSLGLSNKDDVLPIFIGDDKTDEDAFKVLRDSTRGYGILVSSCRKQTNAFYSLRDPTEVMKFLQLLVDWKKQEELKHNGEKHSF